MVMLEHRRLSEILASHPTVKIATTGGTLSPWIAAAFFAEDGLFALDVLLEARGNTLANMRLDPRVAVMIEDSDAFRPFAQGQGHAVIEPEGGGRFAAAIAGKTPASASMVALPGLVPVRLAIDRWQLTDVTAGWLPAHVIRAPAGEAGGTDAKGAGETVDAA
jgi:hypothetical protein